LIIPKLERISLQITVRNSGPQTAEASALSSRPDTDCAKEVRPETDLMRKLILLVVLGLALGACVPIAPPAYLTVPADPAVGSRTAGYTAVTAGVRNYNVVEPLDWRELNRRVAPGTNPERGESGNADRRGR
jgi:hypothetical protein